MNQVTDHKKQWTMNQGDLYLPLELGNKNWKLAFTVGFGQRPPERTIIVGDLRSVEEEISRAKKCFRLFERASLCP